MLNLIIFFGVCLSLSLFVMDAKGQTPRKIVVHETTLRKKATKTVIPKYPEKAVKSKSAGVAVAEITVSEDGSVMNVKILESPNKLIDASMTEALKQWKFYSFYLNGQPQKVTGKITFYFVIENKKAKVESPF